MHALKRCSSRDRAADVPSSSSTLAQTCVQNFALDRIFAFALVATVWLLFFPLWMGSERVAGLERFEVIVELKEDAAGSGRVVVVEGVRSFEADVGIEGVLILETVAGFDGVVLFVPVVGINWLQYSWKL